MRKLRFDKIRTGDLLERGKVAPLLVVGVQRGLIKTVLTMIDRFGMFRTHAFWSDALVTIISTREKF